MLNNTTFNEEDNNRRLSHDGEVSVMVINGKIVSEPKRRHLNEAEEVGFIGEFDIGEAIS